MPLTQLRQPAFKPPREAISDWNTWKKGLNTLLRDTEIEKTECVSALNLMLVGSGVPTKRWGSQNYFLAGATGYGQFVMPIVNSADESISVVALTDWGILTKKNGASYTTITGASWPSGTTMMGAQLAGKVYLASDTKPIARYDFNTLTTFPTIAPPTNVSATFLSAASGYNQWSWRVTAVGRSGGETDATSPVTLNNMPQDLTKTLVRLFWTATSAASGDVVGHNIYRGTQGDELWIGGTDNNVTSFDDPGYTFGDPDRVVPTTNSTGGPQAKYLIRFQDRLVLAGITGKPTRVIISARYPQQDRYDILSGGGFVDIEPDSGEAITGLATYQNSTTNSQTIIVFKERSVWELRLGDQAAFGYVLLDPQYRLLTASQGCSSHKSIQPVENDIMFSNREGIYVLRYQPNLINVINANELSAKIRPFFDSLSDDDLTSAAAAYIDKKYLLSFPNSKQTIIFDRERLSFMGPWTTPYGIKQWAKYVDAAGTERWLAVDAEDAYITEFSTLLKDDKGEVIRTLFKTRKEDFGDWTIFKTLNEVYTHFRAVTGELTFNIYIEERSGNTVTAKTFSIEGSTSSGTAGLGSDFFGDFKFGDTEGSPTTTSSDELTKKAYIYKSARYFQVEVRSDGLTDNFELLGIKAIAIPQARGNSPSSWVAS